MGNTYITKDNSATLKTFINSFVSQEFFINFVKIGLYPSQFGNIALNMSGNNASDYFRVFLKDLNQTVKALNIPNHPQISKLISLTNTIYTIRESNSSVITYDNVFQHIPSLDLPLKTFIEEVKLYRIQDADEFRACTDILINSIQAYHEVKSISSGLILFDNFDEYATSNNISVFEAIKNYKDIVIQLYNDLSKLQTINKLESEKDYFIISDKKSTFDLSETLVKHLTSGYSFLQTGYDVFDNNLQGFESSTVHLISAPSNHGKSLLMINLCNKIIRKNIGDFKPNDGVLFITLEDNIYKLSRRFCSIFGNIEQKVITELHLKTADVSTAESYISNDDHLQKKFINIFQDIFNNSIQCVIDDKLNLIVKHGPENMVSAGDISKFVDTIKVTENINIKLIFIDYVDTMATTVKSNDDDYVKHGTIVQELRNLSRQYKIPIITASQNSKSSENTQFALNNQQMGDSYRKIRYSDFVYMCRQRRDLDPFDPLVQISCFKDSVRVNSDQLSPIVLKYKDLITENLIPMEIKITKSKDDGKDSSDMWLFCKQNLRIYDDIIDYINDIPELVNKTNDLKNEIVTITCSALAAINDDYCNINENIDFEFDLN